MSERPPYVNPEKFLKLEIKAELENVTDLAPSGDDFEYNFKVIFGDHIVSCILNTPYR
jgi:hypothetical protein